MQTLDQSKSYYRRITILDIITILMIIGLMFFSRGFLLSLLLLIVYPFSHSKVLVSDIETKHIKIWVRKMDWDHYLKKHKVNHLMQYKPMQNSKINVKQV